LDRHRRAPAPPGGRAAAPPGSGASELKRAPHAAARCDVTTIKPVRPGMP
jgi:hypothetical protein